MQQPACRLLLAALVLATLGVIGASAAQPVMAQSAESQEKDSVSPLCRDPLGSDAVVGDEIRYADFTRYDLTNAVDNTTGAWAVGKGFTVSFEPVGEPPESSTRPATPYPGQSSARASRCRAARLR